MELMEPELAANATPAVAAAIARAKSAKESLRMCTPHIESTIAAAHARDVLVLATIPLKRPSCLRRHVPRNGVKLSSGRLVVMGERSTT
jgi:glutamate racemase